MIDYPCKRKRNLISKITLRNSILFVPKYQKPLYDMRKDPHEWYNLADDPDYDEIKQQHASWLPEINADPVPGSAHRLLVEKDGTWYWEEEPIDPEARIE
jgi:protoporphyrinogen oxidase